MAFYWTFTWPEWQIFSLEHFSSLSVGVWSHFPLDWRADRYIVWQRNELIRLKIIAWDIRFFRKLFENVYEFSSSLKYQRAIVFTDKMNKNCRALPRKFIFCQARTIICLISKKNNGSDYWILMGFSAS